MYQPVTKLQYIRLLWCSIAFQICLVDLRQYKITLDYFNSLVANLPSEIAEGSQMGSRRYFNTQQNVVQEESTRLVGNMTPQRLRDFCFFFICLNNVNKDLILSIKWLRFLIREKNTYINIFRT